MARPNFTVQLRAPYSFRSAGYVPHEPGIVTSGEVPSDLALEAVSGPPRRRKPKGFVTPLPYSMTRNVYTFTDGVFNLYSRLSGGQVYRHWEQSGNIFGLDSGSGRLYGVQKMYSPQGVPQAMIDRAVIKARLALKDQDVNLGVAFAERNRTAQLLGDTCLDLVNAYRDLRRGRWREAARTLGLTNPRQPRGSSITRKWLEYQYGWQPLLNDVYGSAQALAKLGSDAWNVSAKGSVREAIDVVDTLHDDRETTQYGRGGAVGWRGCFVRIDAQPENPLLIKLGALGLLNPAEIAWELVPFSFVIDWALPFGDYLRSLDALLGYKVVGCSVSTFERFEASFTLEDTPPFDPPGTLYSARWAEREGTSRRQYIALNRSVLVNVPLPQMPRLKDPRSLAHMANGLSLLTQVFGGRR